MISATALPKLSSLGIALAREASALGDLRRSEAIAHDGEALREELGGRWLTADFKAGDALVFGMATVHASLDNRSNRFRLSSDSRYQLASEPADERWIGANPVGHGPAGKLGKAC